MRTRSAACSRSCRTAPPGASRAVEGAGALGAGESGMSSKLPQPSGSSGASGLPARTSLFNVHSQNERRNGA